MHWQTASSAWPWDRTVLQYFTLREFTYVSCFTLGYYLRRKKRGLNLCRNIMEFGVRVLKKKCLASVSLVTIDREAIVLYKESK